ncbi:hypothetical protein [Cellulomonas sp. NPDC089187]|uniref:hypothetical protein n=1 Tax=Cellulomonas sp. NPDC089187 TaxID=3154970 RepID=UPI003440D4EB
MSAATLTAHAPLPSLLRALARAGWGELGGREFQGVRTVLRALADSLPDRSAEGSTTIPQVAQRACLSERWTARCLALLEDAGLIVWTRGGVVAGTPVPSAIRVVKAAVLALIDAARPVREAADRARRAETRARLAEALRLRRPSKRPGPRSRRSDHPALSASLHTPTGEGPTGTSRPGTDYIPETCHHGGLAGHMANGQPKCAQCRRAARLIDQTPTA